jgi:hypothetical protein
MPPTSNGASTHPFLRALRKPVGRCVGFWTSYATRGFAWIRAWISWSRESAVVVSVGWSLASVAGPVRTVISKRKNRLRSVRTEIQKCLRFAIRNLLRKNHQVVKEHGARNSPTKIIEDPSVTDSSKWIEAAANVLRSGCRPGPEPPAGMGMSRSTTP